MANTYKAFKGILQYQSNDVFTKQAGYIYFVREVDAKGDLTGNAEVWFGTRKYGDFNATGLADLQSQITANAGDITSIKNILGEWSAKFQGDISTVASAVVAVSGATTTNTSAITKLNGDAETEGSVAKAVADAKSELVNSASEGYDTLGGLEAKIKAVDQKVTDKNVSAEGDGTYITANAEGNKVIVAASESTKASLALADSALQKADITEGTTNGTINVKGTDVAVHGLGSAAYTDSTAYDASGTAATVKTELLGDAADDYNTLGKLEGKIKAVEAAAKSYEIKAITTGLSSNVKEAYGLFDEDGVQTGATINIYKDSSLKEVKLAGQSLEFTYILTDGTESTVEVDVSTFLAESEFKDGLQVVDGVVSVKKDATSEDFLSVSENGIKLSGVQDAINTGVASAKTYTDETKDTLNAAITSLTNTFTTYTSKTDTTLTGLRNDINDVSGAVADHKTETTGAIRTAKEEAINAATAYTDNAITVETNARTQAFNTLSGAVDTKLDKQTYNDYTANTESVLDTIQKSLSSITKDAVTSIASTGKTIKVVDTNGAVNVEVNTLAVETAQASGYVALETTANGELYGVMYYGGDDAE